MIGVEKRMLEQTSMKKSHCENQGRDLHPTAPQTTSQSPEGVSMILKRFTHSPSGRASPANTVI